MCACSSFDHSVGEVFLLALVHFSEDLDALQTMSSARAPKAESRACVFSMHKRSLCHLVPFLVKKKL